MFMNYTKSLVDQFGFMILLATLTTVVPYAFAAAAQIALFVKEPERFTGGSSARNVLIAVLGFGYSIWAMYATGSESIAKGYLLLMFGIPVYLYMRWRRQRERIPIRTEHVELPTATPEPRPVRALPRGRVAVHGSGRAGTKEGARPLPSSRRLSS